MKYVFAVLLLAGLALAEPDSTPEAEADPAADAWYGYYGRGYGYGGYGLGYRGYYGGYGGYYGGYRGYGGYGYYGRKKRSAEADPAVLAVTHSAPQLPPLFTLMVMLSVTVMVFTMHPLLVIPLNIKQLNIFPVPSQLLPANLQ